MKFLCYRWVGNGYEAFATVDLLPFEIYAHHNVQEPVTGMYVKSNKPITVASAVQLMRPPPNTNSDFGPGIVFPPPVSTLGHTHILPPLAGRPVTTGYLAVVVAAHDDTQVTFGRDGLTTNVLGRGQNLTVQMSSPMPTTVKCSQPCLVVLVNRPRGTQRDLNSESFMMLVPSVGQTITALSFNTFLSPDVR